MIVINLFSLSAFAVNETDSIDLESDACTEVSIQEITDDETETGNNQILQKAVSTQYSFPSLVGGTLLLDYVGDINVLSQNTYTKVVYLNREQTLFFESVYYSDKSDDLLDYLREEGITFITTATIKKIASLIGITLDSCYGIVGFYASTLVFVLENIEKWDFEAALRQSTTKKLKVEYIEYYNSTTFPHYLSIRNFAPWDDGLIVVPKDHDYNWQANVFAMEELSDLCNHQYGAWTSASSSQHVKICQKCGQDVFLSHNYGSECVSTSALQHSKTCVDCGYVLVSPHLFSWTSLNAYNHSGVCSVCKYSKTETHSLSYDQVSGKCKKCGYSGPIQLNSIFTDAMFMRE